MPLDPSNGIGRLEFNRNRSAVTANVCNLRYRNTSVALRVRSTPSTSGASGHAASTNNVASDDSTPSRTSLLTLAA